MIEAPKSHYDYKAGTLTYTKMGLVSLFVLLLWGDFCFTLLETVVPSIMPLHLGDMGASNKIIALILVTIPSAMSMVLTPIVSFKSDGCRSKWGRRIPFLAFATPFVVIFLLLLGYSKSIGHLLFQLLDHQRFSETTVSLYLIAFLMVCFQFFNLFISSVYYYLFNDVVPQAFLARFMSLYRIVGGAAGSLYSYFIFPYANTHMSAIFLGAGLLYLFGFTLMCWKVKEGRYPPPVPNIGNHKGLIATLQTYGTDCFTQPFYWLFYLTNAFQSMSWVTGSFGILLATQVMGFQLEFIGKLAGIAGFIGILLAYPSGILADRIHPLRVMRVIMGLQVISSIFGFMFAFSRPHFTLVAAQYIQILLTFVTFPLGLLYSAAELPMFMRLLPREQYGQFCSANSLVRSFFMVIGGYLFGVFLDAMKVFNPEKPWLCYRFIGIWNAFFMMGSFVCICFLHKEWIRLGGLKKFDPPRIIGR